MKGSFVDPVDECGRRCVVLGGWMLVQYSNQLVAQARRLVGTLCHCGAAGTADCDCAAHLETTSDCHHLSTTPTRTIPPPFGLCVPQSTAAAAAAATTTTDIATAALAKGSCRPAIPPRPPATTSLMRRCSHQDGPLRLRSLDHDLPGHADAAP